jgi:group II intron reverse transcriptase/maturase
MVSRISNPSNDDRNAGHNQPDDTSTQGQSLPRSQGTDSVRGTWSSEGEAGHHLGSNATDRPKTSSRKSPWQRLELIAAQAREYPDMAFTTLAHHLDVPFLERAFDRLNRNSAAGIDRVTWREYEENLIPKLEDLHARLVSREYEPQPVVRQWIPKSNGKLRPLGLPALEDKLVQRAVADLLESIYEQDFHEFSYGFRPGRSAHDALRDLRQGLQSGIHHVIDCDISAFFDNLQHDKLLSILRQRVKDGRVLELIESWLKAGIMDGKELVFPDKGSPQGSVISPLLANVYLHEVLDTWFVEVVTAHCRGKVVLYRYADDFVIGCELESDARRIMATLPKRFAKYGLEVNAEKTRMISFRRPPRNYSRQTHGPKPGTFCFLGFTHYWGRTRKGWYTIKWKTDGRRLRRSVSALWQWCRRNRHLPVEDQYKLLSAKLRGYYQYYGLPFNTEALRQVYFQVTHAWRYWLNRRGGRKKLDWPTFQRLMSQFHLPLPRIVHGWDKMGNQT